MRSWFLEPPSFIPLEVVCDLSIFQSLRLIVALVALAKEIDTSLRKLITC